MTDLQQFGILTGRGKHAEEAMYCLALIYNICNAKITNYLKKYGLSIGKFNILVAIKVHGGEEGLSQVDISKHLIVTPSNMTKLIDKLEKDGLVTRSPLPKDRRVNIIKVTKKAADLIDGIWEEYTKQLNEQMKGLDDEDKSIVAAKLVKWLNTLM